MRASVTWVADAAPILTGTHNAQSKRQFNRRSYRISCIAKDVYRGGYRFYPLSGAKTQIRAGSTLDQLTGNYCLRV